MDTGTKKLKASVVGWLEDGEPLMDCLYADSSEEMDCVQKKWMDRHGLDKCRVHLYRRKTTGEWNLLCRRTVTKESGLPDFMMLVPGVHEMNEGMTYFMNTFVQTGTGRMVRMVPRQLAVNGLVDVNVVYQAEDARREYVLSVIHLPDNERELLRRGRTEQLMNILAEGLIEPFTQWFVKHMTAKPR